MINSLSEQIEKELTAIEFPLGLPGLYDPISYTLNLEGKRIRPLLTLLGARMFDSNSQLGMKQAMGLEIFHNFTLVHDDIMDAAPIRRGKESVYKKWDSNTAILSGDVMFALSVEYISQCDKDQLPQVLSCFLDTAIKVCEGQQMDMDFEKRRHVDLSEYLKMVELKTSYLLAGSIKIGAIVAGADKINSNKLFDVMMKAGTAFQLMDDYLDVFGDPKKFGKQLGGDIISGKKTYLYLRSLEKCNDIERKRLEKLYDYNFSRDESNVLEVRNIFIECGADKDLLSLSENLMSSCKTLLQEIDGDEKIKDELINLSFQLINREK